MKIATFNVNGVNGRLPALLAWLAESRPDVVCLQELKAPQERFPEAAIILRHVVKAVPDNYVARANLATALYESKRYAEAVPEYEWILTTKPETAVAHYFIATAHDYLGEYPEALASYEKFLTVADAKTNQLEIDKVKLRLPMLRRQIQLGEGAKKKP